MPRNANKRRSGAQRRRQESGLAVRKLPENISRMVFQVPVSVSLPPNCIGFPDRMTTILKYSELFSFGANPQPAGQYFKMNSAFDPNGTGTGHQPSFYDIYTSVYGRYFVRQFKLVVDFVNAGTVGVDVVALYSDTQLTANTVEQLTESKYCIARTMGISTGARSAVTLTLPWMTSGKLMGQPFAEADDSMYALISADPADIAFGTIKVAATDLATNVIVQAKVTLFMEIVFKDLSAYYAS